ncbi:MAG: acetyl-CoA carboxylase biotin carboxyl carrier protein [Candidatus Omnitrophica bacterium]|nr:acetyl-CoA carboxylase biotin carboxyl carrier protein [Candidatus Omnitrophota bacterium]
MNIKKIKELVELMNDNDLTQIEIEQEGTKVKLTKKGEGVIEKTVSPVAAPQAPSAAVPAAEGGVAEKTAPPQKTGKEVTSPMVGTFYKSPSPDADAYVKVGDTIQKGDVLCIVEAMKLMNEVKAEFGGKVIEICVENAEPVEFGQPLFIIE